MNYHKTDPQPIEHRRDHLFVTLTAIWPRIANGTATPEEYARYWTLQAEYERANDELQAALLEQPAAVTPDPYPLCPECEGIGYVEGELLFAGNYDMPPEYDCHDCPVCGGLGTLEAPYGQPVIDSAAVAAWL
jgi:hypothetical protein